jgi:hypothetical protein
LEKRIASQDRDGRHEAGHDVVVCHPRRTKCGKGVHRAEGTSEFTSPPMAFAISGRE